PAHSAGGRGRWPPLAAGSDSEGGQAWESSPWVSWQGRGNSRSCGASPDHPGQIELGSTSGNGAGDIGEMGVTATKPFSHRAESLAGSAPVDAELTPNWRRLPSSSVLATRK